MDAAESVSGTLPHPHVITCLYQYVSRLQYNAIVLHAVANSVVLCWRQRVRGAALAICRIHRDFGGRSCCVR